MLDLYVLHRKPLNQIKMFFGMFLVIISTENILNKVDHYFIPIEDNNGEIDYLGTKYSLKKVVNNNV